VFGLKRRERVYRALKICGATLIVGGFLLVVDGIGSILIGWGQHHDILFDFERFIRAIYGFVNMAIGIYLRKREK